MPIRAVLFDRDGVLVRVDWRGMHDALMSKLPMPPRELEERWQRWVVSQGAGFEDGDPHLVNTFLGTIAEEINDPVTLAALRAFRLSDFLHLYPDAWLAIERSRNAGLRVGVLSNNTLLLGARGILVLLGLDKLADVTLTAQCLGVSKPDPLAYRLAAEALGVQRHECLFFDDRWEWVAAARRLGIQAFHVDRNRTDDCLEEGVVHSLDALAPLLRQRSDGWEA